MARYGKEADIEVARKRSLEQVSEQIRREEASIATSEKSLQTARTEAAAHKGKVPPVLQRRIDDLVQEIADGTKRIAERKDEMAQINTRYDQAVKRFRELSGAGDAHGSQVM